MAFRDGTQRNVCAFSAARETLNKQTFDYNLDGAAQIGQKPLLLLCRGAVWEAAGLLQGSGVLWELAIS
jgi:hypothetical protein